MFQWKDDYQWIFSNLGAADKVGVNESGIGIFKRQQYKGLAKEILQNVTDAKDKSLPEDIPVRARFEVIYVERDEIPGFERLNDVIHKCCEYYPDGDDGEKLKGIQTSADKYLSAPGKVPVLKIGDYNTTGLRGVREETGSNWTGLVRERSATNKSNGYSGAFGVGKFAPYNFSSLRTILYSTKTDKGEIAFQGKTILTTFKEKGENKQNIGLFANTDSDNFDAIFNIDEIAPVFRRTEIGTDIFVLGFEKEEDWVEQCAISVIEYFFYSIYKGNLEVEICDGEKSVEIKQDNLGAMIEKYDDYCKEYMAGDITFRFTAPSYWRLLTDPRHKVIREPFKFGGRDMGGYELYLLIGDDLSEKKVLEMRQAGMRIREDMSFRIQINFTAIFIATGEGAASENPKDNISSFLRKCENQAHDDWAADEYKEEKDTAKKIINEVHKKILDAVKKEMPDLGDETVDAFGLSEFLPNEEADDDQKEEKAFSDFKPLSFEIQSLKIGKRRRQADISMRTNGGSKHKKKEKSGEEKEHKYKKKTDNNRGTGMRKASEVLITRIKTPFDSISGKYQVSFLLEEDAKDLMLSIKIGSDDDNLAKAEISEAYMSGKKLAIKNGMVALGDSSAGEKKILQIKLAEKSRKTLEVRAYAKH